MKRKGLALILIIIIAMSSAARLVYNQISELQTQINELQAQKGELQDQNNALQAQVSDLQSQNSVLQDRLDEKYGASPVQITASKLTGWSPIVGLTISSQVNVTVQNKGTTELSGLTLTVRLVYNNTEVGYGYSKQINGFRAGETREFSGNVLYGISTAFAVESTVKLGDMVLARAWTG